MEKASAEALSAMPRIQDAAECWLQVQAVHFSPHLCVLMHCSSPHNKQKQHLGSTTILWIKAGAFETHRGLSRSGGSSLSVCSGKAAVPASVQRQELPAAGASQSSWIIKQRCSPHLWIPSACSSGSKAYVNSQKVFTGKVWYQQNSNFQWERTAAVFIPSVVLCMRVGLVGCFFSFLNEMLSSKRPGR